MVRQGQRPDPEGTLVYQTIPQNVKLEPGETYKVSFKYQSGSDDIYAIATGDGEYNASTVKLTNLKKALGEDGTAEFEITGSITGDSWFGIYSTSTAPDLQNTSDSAAAFGGYKDFVLDDLKVEHVASAERTKPTPRPSSRKSRTPTTARAATTPPKSGPRT